MADNKIRVIKSLDNLTDELRDLLHKQYPNGYEGSITRITNAKKEPIFVFPLETAESIILVKVPATKNSEGEYDVESNPEPEFDDNSDGEDDNFESSNDSSSYGDDEYESGKSSREASYDPDFDG